MVTTIQVNENTLQLLKKIKLELSVQSYDEAIKKVVIERTKGESMAGSLKKYFKNKSSKELLKELQNERRKSDRF